ncbi:kinase-like domain-containing protein [Rhizophagus irregularis DAOM 181602=DAOM 197198]|nr:kinase-like domain-containing protein [Rhizophagus irregularis DAOM 181602=DAOM 197198]
MSEQNETELFHQNKKEAENGNKAAMYWWAECYDYGEGTEKNLEKAFYWYQKAAENGNEDAMNMLANGSRKW